MAAWGMTMQKNERLMSLDALRGFDMLWIMGFSGAVVALCSLVGAKDCWLATQMSHVSWEGFRHHDTIFPLFLFLAGVSWPFSYASQVAKGTPTGRIVLRGVKRMALLVLFGLIAGRALEFNFARYRYDSVLAHIGVCWFAAAMLYVFVRNWKARLAIVFGLLVGYWALVFFIPAPDAATVLASTDPAVAKKVAQYASLGTGNWSPVGSFACWVDRTFEIGVCNERIFNADGVLASNPPVTAEALAQILTAAL